MTVRTKPACGRCRERLAAEQVPLGRVVHVVCCDKACSCWPCDGTHLDQPAGEHACLPSDGGIPDYVRTGPANCPCGRPGLVPGGVCSTRCLAQLAHRYSTGCAIWPCRHDHGHLR